MLLDISVVSGAFIIKYLMAVMKVRHSNHRAFGLARKY
jgi:hypothetical protein